MAKVVKVLHLTTHDEECGIAKYQEQFLVGMRGVDGIENVVFEYSPNQTKIMTPSQFAPVFKKFNDQLKNFDILHIQHEISFFHQDELDQFVTSAKNLGKKVIITVHTSPDAGMPKVKLTGVSVRSGLDFARQIRRKNFFKSVHLVPLRKADLVIVHNSVTKNSLIKHRIKRDRIKKITMPVPNLSFNLVSRDITNRLHRQPGDIIFCTVGFVSENKGMRQAIQALTKLGNNYKLAIIGGKHPSGANNAFYDELVDLVDKLKLGTRVYMTGYVKEDDKLNALIRECDLCVYPFEKNYYAGVTSASLNNSLANFVPAITFPTQPILEMNAQMPAVTVTKSFSYIDLVKEIKNINIDHQKEVAKRYAKAFSYDKEALKFVDLYRKLA